MNLDELQSAQARERQSSDLQHLRSSFYREVGEFIEKLNRKRARVVESADDPFSEPEVRRLTDDIETAESTVEAIYERRIGKVVKKASIAAAGMPVEADGLTSEEEALFEDLVARIEGNRETVLSVLEGDSPNVSCSVDEETESAPHADLSGRTTHSPVDESSSADDPTAREDSTADNGGISAADLMGRGDTEVTEPDVPATDPRRPADDSKMDQPDETSGNPPEHGSPETNAPPSSEPSRDTDGSESTPPTPGSAADSGESTRSVQSTGGRKADRRTDEESKQIPGLPRTTVRITADVGEIVGADDRDYDLGAEDVVTLPEPNADVLVNKNAAERL